MKLRSLKYIIFLIEVISITSLACAALTPVLGNTTPTPVVEDTPTNEPATLPTPNASGIEGVVTQPDRAAYHQHVQVIDTPTTDLPPMFGAHYPAWQNCGIYDQPVELGSALHSMEHGAVWLTYAPNLDAAQVTDLQNLVRGHAFVLMSPYLPQTKPVVLTAWGTQLVIDSLPDDRIAKFIAYYELGPQNPEPGAPCSGAIGEPLP